MGMDYNYAGSASYPRFDEEICKVAEVFGGIKTEYLKQRKETENERPFGYWFGFLSSDNSDETKFIFPEDTNATLVKWFNNLYEDLSQQETEVVAELIFQHPEIKEISEQLWYEFECLIQCGDNWSIC